MSNAEKPTGAYVWCMGPVSAVAAPVPCASSGEWSGQGHREAAPGERAVASPGHWISAHSLAGLESSFLDRKSTRLNSSHTVISYAVFCLKKKKTLQGSYATT